MRRLRSWRHAYDLASREHERPEDMNQPRDIIVHTGSRLHFGLLNLGASPRQFGGVGLMVHEPGLRVRVTPAERWSSEGPSAERALDCAREWSSATRSECCFHVAVEKCPPEHVGLGTGTQLGLAVARALAKATDRKLDAIELAKCIGRGQRSALGIHGFAQGGFLIEGGKGERTAIAPLLARVDFPEDWPMLLVIPRNRQGTHGVSESQAIARLVNEAPSQDVDALCRLVLLGMLPALHERDLPAFSEALYEFNRRAGEMFRPIQGGTYGHPQTAEIVHWLRQHGTRGVGQSSWGPTVFAIIENGHAAEIVHKLQQAFELAADEVIVTSGQNEGASLKEPRTK